MNTQPAAPILHTPAMVLVRSSRLSRVVARLLVAAFVLASAVLYFTPWQQTATGVGRVVAYAPDERQQDIGAPIDGRIHRWLVREGSTVKKGEPIVDLTDIDPEIFGRLQRERDAIAARLENAQARVQSLESRIASLDLARHSGLVASDARIRMAEERVVAAEQAVALANATLSTAQLNVARQQSLTEQGLTSQRQLELTELEQLRAQTEVERAKAALAAARSEEAALVSDRSKIGSDAMAAINDARAAQAAAEVDVANASAELARTEVRLARQSAQWVTAPRDGTILRILANGHQGEIVKAGDVLAVLVPEASERAVELWIPGNDMPLVLPGAPARIQFEGWPALQFSGWPSVAVGTFAGRVDFVDAHDSGEGKFRVLIVPAHRGDWPSGVYLRQGVRTQGWVQLGRVRLGYELWRIFNGFPPALPNAPETTATKSGAIESLGKAKEKSP